MSGYTPTILELTPVSAGTAGPGLLQLLRRNYHFAWPRGVERQPGGGRIVGAVTLGDNRVTLEAYTRPDDQDGSKECLIIDLDSAAYEGAYDLLRERAHPRGKQALIDFCIEVAAAVKAEGFRLRFVADDPVSLSVERLVEAMTTSGGSGLVAGLVASSAFSDRIRGYWFGRLKEILGYLVIELI
ncbi:MAG TPA: hypothetical protein VFT22_11150 [Kofleriaceae bacterium]|nr:hypothetical protein [Kofleriaceae bacterium]